MAQLQSECKNGLQTNGDYWMDRASSQEALRRSPVVSCSASDAEGDCSSGGPEAVSSETETQPQEFANRGLLGRLREISWFERVRGRPGGTKPRSRKSSVSAFALLANGTAVRC